MITSERERKTKTQRMRERERERRVRERRVRERRGVVVERLRARSDVLERENVIATSENAIFRKLEINPVLMRDERKWCVSYFAWVDRNACESVHNVGVWVCV